MLRVEPLLNPHLVQMVDFGAEGGVYSSPFGEIAADDSGLQSTLSLSPDAERRGLRPDAVALHLVESASSASADRRDDFAAALASVRLAQGAAVHVTWREPHLHPEAFLAAPLRQLTDGAHGPGLWFERQPTRGADRELRYQRTGGAAPAGGAARQLSNACTKTTRQRWPRSHAGTSTRWIAFRRGSSRQCRTPRASWWGNTACLRFTC